MTTHHALPRARAPQVLDRPRFALLARIATRLADTPPADQRVLDAVAALTADADPARAARLAPSAGEPAALVERLAVWALHRADDDAVARAAAILDDRSSEPSPVADRRAAAPVPAANGLGRTVAAAACGA